ncbi:factor-independent urate hydroxylase [Actinomadura sp. HBU206391]|uniref:factor-independent urate hydroxylase n=1 Tax=Actinomadura sp. HBU206391 TaxID=2731692 RepID=UPI0016507CE3|nr:urate oxidase [Actinomadura sp. HBU206391]MBC6461853.1 urate oxidase [Actinomadura sp. HBU206391]
MGIALGPNQYGKAETRVVRVSRDGDHHEIKDLNVSVALSGAMEAVHLTGDNSAVLPTDTQKNTVFAFAREHGIASAEEFALLLARHFVNSQPTVHRARLSVEEYAWDRIPVTGHSFVRRGQEIRTARVAAYEGERAHVVSGLRDLTVLNSTGSEFWGFLKDGYTTLPETRDRILATTVNAEWRHTDLGTAWDTSYGTVRRLLLETFAGTHSLSLQQTLYAMGRRVLEECPAICEVRLAMPNKHHFAVDLEPFGMDNPNEVFHAADRPYGVIEGSVLRDDAPGDERSADQAWW